MKSCLSAVILIIWFIYSSYFVFAVAQPLYHSSLLLGCFCYCKIGGTLLKRSYTGKLPLYFTWPSISFPSFLPCLSIFLTAVPAAPMGGSGLGNEGLLLQLPHQQQREGGWHVGSRNNWCRLHGQMLFLFGRSALFVKFQQPCFGWLLRKHVSKLYWCGDLAGASCWYDLCLSFKVCDNWSSNAEESEIGRGSFSTSPFPSEASALDLPPLNYAMGIHLKKAVWVWKHSVICSVEFLLACHLLHWPFEELDKESLIYSLGQVYMEITVFYYCLLFFILFP